MAYREFVPSPPLRAFVECFWHLRTSGGAAWESIYPDGCSELVFNLGEPAEELRDGAIVRQPRHLAYGQLDRRLVLRGAAATEVLGVRLQPSGGSALFGIPGDQLSGRATSIGELSPPLASRLISVAEDDLSPSDKIARLDARLRAWIRERELEPAATAPIARHLRRTPAATADDIRALTGWSTRTAQRRFRSEIGLAPKRFLQVTRFMRFLRLVNREREAPISQLAVAAGYYDQPHLHRDLRRFTGATPTAFRSKSRETFDRLYGRERLERLVVV